MMHLKQKTVCVMKKMLLFVILGLCLHMDSFAQKRTIQSLVGHWEAVDSENASGGIEVLDSSKLFLVYGTERKPIVSYTADFTKAPGWFDFTIKDSSGTMALKSLLQFINDDLIQWQVFDESVRPAHFVESEGTMVYLRRKK